MPVNAANLCVKRRGKQGYITNFPWIPRAPGTKVFSVYIFSSGGRRIQIIHLCKSSNNAV